MTNEPCWPVGCETPDACSRIRRCSGTACAHRRRDPQAVGIEFDALLDEIEGTPGFAEDRVRDAATRTAAIQAVCAREGNPQSATQRRAALDELAAMTEEHDF